MNQEDTDMFSTWFRKANISTPTALEELPLRPPTTRKLPGEGQPPVEQEGGKGLWKRRRNPRERSATEKA